MNNEPVAWMGKDYDGIKTDFYFDVERNKLPYRLYETAIPLYTHPAKEQYKFGVDWSKDGNAVTVLKICEDGVAEVVFMDYQEVTHPADLTDEEIWKLWQKHLSDDIPVFARAILRKAQEG